jgi:hypothetical protein
MMVLIVLTGDDVFEAYELRLLDSFELFDGEDVRRKEVRMVENERDWKREVLILAQSRRVWRGCSVGRLGCRSGAASELIKQVARVARNGLS